MNDGEREHQVKWEEKEGGDGNWQLARRKENIRRKKKRRQKERR